MFLNKPRYFKLPELVDPWTYEKFGQKAWWFLDPTAVQIQDALRERYGPATVNNWSWGGKLKYRGFRPPQCRTGSKLSFHRLGKGFDSTYKNVTAAEVRKDLKELIRDGIGPFCLIGAIEKKVPWLHFDVRSMPAGNTMWFNP